MLPDWTPLGLNHTHATYFNVDLPCIYSFTSHLYMEYGPKRPSCQVLYITKNHYWPSLPATLSNVVPWNRPSHRILYGITISIEVEATHWRICDEAANQWGRSLGELLSAEKNTIRLLPSCDIALAVWHERHFYPSRIPALLSNAFYVYIMSM